MPIGRYYRYRCKKCGYTFVKFQSDVIMPINCPKCGGEVEIVEDQDPIDKIIRSFQNLFAKGKK